MLTLYQNGNVLELSNINNDNTVAEVTTDGSNTVLKALTLLLQNCLVPHCTITSRDHLGAVHRHWFPEVDAKQIPIQIAERGKLVSLLNDTNIVTVQVDYATLLALFEECLIEYKKVTNV